MKTVILVNVGTPNSPEPEDVGIYLKEFLMDENIISIPRPFRDILVKGLIVPRRKFSSSEKYKKVWTEKGSPLLFESESLKNKLQNYLGQDWNVEIAMQVGEPRLRDVIRRHSSERSDLYFCPLYPQYATATTGGALKTLDDQGQQARVLKPFYSASWFIKAQAENIRKKMTEKDHLLLSYHGLPISQLKEKNSTCYKTNNCCKQGNTCEINCYKAQCLKTSELLKKELNLTEVSIGFQSRLGRAKWIEPSTEDVVAHLLAKRIKHLKVACPSFVSDCLETLEEIGMELRQKFLSNGGESFELIRCVNDSDLFVQGLGDHLKGL